MTSRSLAGLQPLLLQDWQGASSAESSARRQWWAALEVLQEGFRDLIGQGPGVWLAAPLPALYEPALLERFQGWVWAPEQWDRLLGNPLLPPDGTTAAPTSAAPQHFERLNLTADDGSDPFLILITPRLQVAIALLGPADARQLVVRHEPACLSAALTLLDGRLLADHSCAAQRLRQAMQALGPLNNERELGRRFWPLLSARLADMVPSLTLQTGAGRSRAASRDVAAAEPSEASLESQELALLEALSHEVRTPLATIRTLIRSLLKRQGLSELVQRQLRQIDAECSEQIDRFGLIFRAAEMQRRPERERLLARTDLAALVRRQFPLWQRLLLRRGHRLRLDMDGGLPEAMSDPGLLAQMLGGVVDRFSRSLPARSSVLLRLEQAGERLKLQLALEGDEVGRGDAASEEVVGTVLTWRPETGSLQLSSAATRRLLSSLGARLWERSDRLLTMFLPLATSTSVPPPAAGRASAAAGRRCQPTSDNMV